MKNILALAIVLLSLTAGEDGVLFTPKGKTYIMWTSENSGITYKFITNKNGERDAWRDYHSGVAQPEHMNAYYEFDYEFDYPNLKITLDDTIVLDYVFIEEDIFSPKGHFEEKFTRID